MQTLAGLREQVRGDALDGATGLSDGLLDDPDCLAELEFTYSVFRFRYEWGTMYELTFTNHSDAHDRTACWALVPSGHIVIHSEDTDTTGVGHNGVIREVTHRVLALN